MCKSGLVVCLLCIYSVFPSAFSNHFFGGNIMIRPKPGGTQSEIQISYHIAWKHRTTNDELYCNSNKIASREIKDGDDSIDCIYGCQNTVTISDMSYICTGYSSGHTWSYGEGHKTHNFSVFDVNQVTIGTTGCCWVIDTQLKWNISTTFSLVPRNDTGQINSSPRVVGFPYLRIPTGSYNYTIRLAVTDPDNDRIQCRWAVGMECADICDGSVGALLDSDACTITYPANGRIRLKGIAIVVEDFWSGSLQPLSSVSHQFVVHVASSSRTCFTTIPQFVAPTYPDGTCIVIPPGTLFTKQIVATSRCSGIGITAIQIIGPIGTNRGPLHKISNKYYYKNITWMPTANQQNDTHLLCYLAVSAIGHTSEQSCIKLAVGYHPLTPLRETATPNHQLVDPSNTTLHIMFDKTIQRPLTSAFIRFFKSVGDLEVYQIDVSLSSEVTYFKSGLTIVPNFTFTEGSTYYVNFDEGVAQSVDSVGGCQSVNNSIPILSNTFWTFEVKSLTSVFTSSVTLIAVNNQMAVGQPLILQCSVTTIRDINSTVDFVWISNGTELERVEGVTGTSSTNNLTIYTNHYIISQLSIADTSLYACEVIINRSPLISATGNFTLNTVFTSSVSVTALSNQMTVGQPLILQCSVTTIRDINSRVDFVWISNGTELERVEGVIGVSSTSNLAVYTDHYIISQLSIADNNSLYTCEVIINRSPLISATGNFTLNTVFTSSVSVTALSNQMAVGQRLILQCSVTTIRDINSRVDFVWISNGTELKRMEGVTDESPTNNLAIYTDHYIISQLSIADNNSLYTCEVIINRSPLISATGNFTLNITGTNLKDDGHGSNTSLSCTLPPIFVDPTSPQRQCIVIPPGMHFVQQIMATSGCSNITITSIHVSAPNGTSVGELQHVQGTNHYYINVVWMPTADQQSETHFLCFVAVNSAGLSSELFCMELAAGYLPPAPIPESANHQLVYPSSTTLHIMFDRAIQRPSTSAFISFYKLGEEVYQIDVSLSTEVTFTDSTLTIVPNYIFTEGSTYYINFDQGVVQTVYPQGCLLVNEALLSNTFWTFEFVNVKSVFTSSVSVTALNNQMTVGQPLILQCSVTTIRDINSRVDFVWISNGTELERVEGVTGESSANNLAVYTDHYIIPQLSIADNNSLYICKVIVNTVQLVSAAGNFILNLNMLETEVVCNDDDAGDDDDGFGFLILFAISAVVNLLLVAAVTILICLLMRRKKDKPIDPNHKAKNKLNVTASETIYDLPTLTSKDEKGKDSVTNYGYTTFLNQKEAKSQKQDTKSDNSKIKMEENPAYGSSVTHTSNL